MPEYKGGMPKDGIPQDKAPLLPVTINTYAPQPPHTGWVARVKLDIHPHSTLDVGHGNFYTTETDLLVFMAQNLGILLAE